MYQLFNVLLKSFFQVCELHFQPGDIRNETSYYDKKTGNLLTAKLKYPSLCEDAIPRILPNCPAYLSSTVPIRESPDSKRIRQENSALKSALAQSIADEIANKKRGNLIILMIWKESYIFWTLNIGALSGNRDPF